MMHEPIVVAVEKNLERLVPVFLKQRNADVQTLRNALQTADFDAIRRAGHSMTGAGKSYGFDRISELGTAIENAAQARNLTQIKELEAELSDYLSRLHVTYV